MESGNRGRIKTQECEDFDLKEKHPLVDHESNKESTLTGLFKDAVNQKTEIEICLSGKRWLVLFIYSMISMSNGAIGISLASISDITMAYYQIPYDMVNWLSMSFLLCYTILALPASLFISKYGLKTGFLVTASFNAIGSCLRYAGVDRTRFVFVATGQLFAAIAYAFLLQLAPKLAAAWFGEHERATATSVGVLMNLVGVAVGFLQPAFLVKGSDNMDIVRDGMNMLLLSQAIFCVVFVFAAYLFIDEKPNLPPSQSEALRDGLDRQSTHSSLKECIKFLFKSKSFNLTSQAYAIMFGVMTCLSTLLNQTMKSTYAFVSDFQIGLLGFSATLLGSFFTFLVGIILDKYQKYKFIAVLLFILSILSLTGFTLVLLQTKNFILLSVMYCLANAAIFPYMSCGLQQISEITYPIEEEISCVFPLIFGNFYGFLSIYLFGLIIDLKLLEVAYGIIIFMATVGLNFSLTAKVSLRRSYVDHVTTSQTSPRQK